MSIGQCSRHAGVNALGKKTTNRIVFHFFCVSQKLTRKTQRDKHNISTDNLALETHLGEIVISTPGEDPAEVAHGPAALILTTVVKVG